ncbi:hypothetical protein AB0D71_19770 [Streptomyces avermitilis]|uniref:hypothetical protein n=1 Tax=Streptomyces avermitilis TaxID=33903 RepID=UPI0033E5179A
MEQRIGSNSQPLDVAAVDPAFIPGLTPTVSAEPKSTAEPEGAAEPEKAEVADEASPEDKTSEEAPDGEAAKKPSLAKDSAKASGKAAGKGSAKESAKDSDEPADEAEAGSEGPDSEGSDSEGPVFEASDRRASIVADRGGVRLRLDDQEAEFRWDEIGAVETESPRFGKRFTITVHTPDRRWYPIEIEASSRSRFKEWETKLDDVLDAYFQE